MYCCNFFTQFNNSFMAGAGFNLGVGLGNFVFGNIFGYSSSPFGSWGGNNCGSFVNNSCFESFNPYPVSTFSNTNIYQNIGNFSFNTNSASLWDTMPAQQISFNSSSNPWNNFGTQNYSWDSFAFNTSASSGTSRTTTGSTTSTRNTGTGTSSVISAQRIGNTNVSNIQWWRDQGYNEQKGLEFAEKTRINSDRLRSQGVTGQCGRGVRLGINDTFYGGATHYQKFGQARLTGEQFLSTDKHFKKLDITGLHFEKGDIPAGAIVIYDAGYSNSRLSYCGHIEVSDGNGHGYSDFTSTLLCHRGNRREPLEIWIPV